MITKNLPLTDLHRHLDGNIRTKTILELGQKFGIALPAYDIESLTPHVQIVEAEPSLVAFLSKLDWGVAVLGDLDACRRVAYENVEDALNAQIDYAELRFSPYYMAMKHKLPVAGVVEAVVDGVQAGDARLWHQSEPYRYHEPHIWHRCMSARTGCHSKPERPHRSSRPCR